ncbi:protein of unknown function [Bradyrhizobium vignae]|uniref:Uncharacterized protein n=1 Tax=Bradyrhizobium vignae TaxID=1549949 RepID=A0A2U3Q506_9BRAD|nr:protein of unknown function [Bradyrhizobium vignae]
MAEGSKDEIVMMTEATSVAGEAIASTPTGQEL